MTTNAKKQVIEILNERIEMLERLIERQSGISGILNAMANDLKRERLSAFKEVRDLLIDEQPTLNENQQIVLEYLKTQFGKHEIFVKSIFDPIQELLFDYWDDEVDTAFEQLDLKQEIQVLEVFSDWALEQEEGNE